MHAPLAGTPACARSEHAPSFRHLPHGIHTFCNRLLRHITAPSSLPWQRAWYSFSAISTHRGCCRATISMALFILHVSSMLPTLYDLQDTLHLCYIRHVAFEERCSHHRR